MTDEEIFETVVEVFVENFEVPAEDVTKDARIYEELGLDSLDSVDLIVALQESFGIQVDRVADAEKLQAIRTISDILDYINEKKEK